jgi:alkylhydroperoxidase family enzyme
VSTPDTEEIPMSTTVVRTSVATARVPLTHRRTPYVRLMEAYSRRRYGAVLEPGLVALHHRGVLRTMLRTEAGVAKWDRLDPSVKALATLAAAAGIGCSWCLDFGYWESRNRDIPAAKLDAITRWRDTDVYTALERTAIEYAEAMTATPPTVDDALVDRLRTWLDDAQLVELTAIVAQENYRSRVNAAMGLTGQGFKDHCDLPAGRG